MNWQVIVFNRKSAMHAKTSIVDRVIAEELYKSWVERVAAYDDPYNYTIRLVGTAKETAFVRAKQIKYVPSETVY